MLRASIVIGVVMALALPALACDPAVITRGKYAFPHNGVKPSGELFATLVVMDFKLASTTTGGATVAIIGTVSIRNEPPKFVAFEAPYYWASTADCTIVVGYSFTGLVETDGSRIYFAILNGHEQTAGVAYRMVQE